MNSTQVLRKPLKIWVSLLLLSLLLSCGTPSMNALSMPAYQLSGQTRQGDFKLLRLAMAFESGLPDMTLQRGDVLKPVATIDFRGSGSLRAKWLLDDRVLEQVNIVLHRGSVLRLAPLEPISTAALVAGQHRIRLQIMAPGSGFSQPELKFFITP